MDITNHASTRLQQRGIPLLVIDLLMQFGRGIHIGDGVLKYYFDKPGKRKVRAYAGPLARVLDEHLNVYAVVAPDTSVITVGHLHERIRHS